MTFPGSIVYAKAGNIWIQTGKDVRQLTNSGRDSMPSVLARRQVDLLHPARGPARPRAPGSGRCTWYDLADAA